MIVPKIIWQTHNYEINELPDHLRNVIKAWQNVNPGWDHRYVSHTERIETVKKYPVLFEHYQKQTPMYQADIWRYIVTYEHGGVYADMDSVCIKPLDYLLATVDDCELLVVPPSHNPGAPTNNANYAVKKESDVMKQILDYCSVDGYNEKYEYKGTWTAFMDSVTKSNSVGYEFTAAWHTQEFKEKFQKHFSIDYYGSSITYLDFLEKYSLSII